MARPEGAKVIDDHSIWPDGVKKTWPVSSKPWTPSHCLFFFWQKRWSPGIMQSWNHGLYSHGVIVNGQPLVPQGVFKSKDLSGNTTHASACSWSANCVYKYPESLKLGTIYCVLHTYNMALWTGWKKKEKKSPCLPTREVFRNLKNKQRLEGKKLEQTAFTRW